MVYVDHKALIAFACFGYLGFLVRNLVKKRSAVQHIMFTVFYSYVTGVLAVTLFPIPVVPDFAQFEAQHNLVPFESVARLVSLPFRGTFRQLFGNILLLFPLGFFLLLLRPNVRLIHAILVGVGCSLMIELAQVSIGLILRFNYRSFDVDDILLNTLGCMCGYAAMRLFARFNPWVAKATLPLGGER